MKNHKYIDLQHLVFNGLCVTQRDQVVSTKSHLCPAAWSMVN